MQQWLKLKSLSNKNSKEQSQANDVNSHEIQQRETNKAKKTKLKSDIDLEIEKLSKLFDNVDNYNIKTESSPEKETKTNIQDKLKLEKQNSNHKMNSKTSIKKIDYINISKRTKDAYKEYCKNMQGIVDPMSLEEFVRNEADFHTDLFEGIAE
ncbi:hypothetical protein WA158_005624 [Blastocystis sp. Blastoise]